MKNKHGFTLVELVVVMAITLILLSSIGMIFSLGTRFYRTDISQSENQGSIRTVVTSVEKNLRIADSVSSTLGCLVITVSSGPQTYCLIGNNIMLNGKIFADKIKTFTYTLLLTNSQVVIHIESTMDSQGKSSVIDTTINLRKAGN